MPFSFLNPEYLTTKYLLRSINGLCYPAKYNHINNSPIDIDDFSFITANDNTEALYRDQTFTIHKMCLKLTLYLNGGMYVLVPTT